MAALQTLCRVCIHPINMILTKTFVLGQTIDTLPDGNTPRDVVLDWPALHEAQFF